MHFESAIPGDAIHYPSIISFHTVSETVHTLKPFCFSSTPPLPYIPESLVNVLVVYSSLFTAHSGPTKVINTSSRCGCLVQLGSF